MEYMWLQAVGYMAVTNGVIMQNIFSNLIGSNDFIVCRLLSNKWSTERGIRVMLMWYPMIAREEKKKI